jgi:hypothetical protein
MRALPALGSFDLVWILGDAVNYLDGPDELADTFAGVRRNLAGGGILIFDAATLLSFRTSYAGLLVRPGSERVLVLDGHGDPALPAGGAAEVWIDRLRPEGNGGWWRRERTVHHLRHHPEPVIRGALAAAGLACVDVRGNRAGGEAEPWLDELSHTKALYIARQEAPDRDEGR